MSGESGYNCPKCNFHSTNTPSKCWNCGFDWVEKQESRADLLARVKELEVSCASLKTETAFSADGIDRRDARIRELESQLHQRDTSLNAAREALDKSKSLLEKNNNQHGESACWSHDKKHEGQNRAAWLIEENDSHIKGTIDHALSQIQAVSNGVVLDESCKDKARMDWLCSDPNGEVSFTIRDGVSRTSDARCLREAIDEEMDKSTSQIQAVKL